MQPRILMHVFEVIEMEGVAKYYCETDYFIICLVHGIVKSSGERWANKNKIFFPSIGTNYFCW